MPPKTSDYHVAQDNSSLKAPFLEGETNTFFSAGEKAAMLTLFQFYDREETLDIQYAKLALEAVLYGNEKEALFIITKRPGCLLQRVKATDYSGRIIEATPLQGALGAMDDLLYNKIIPFFSEIPQLIEQAQKEERDISDVVRDKIISQFNEQFPQGIDVTPASELQDIYTTLVNEIINGNGEAAIVNFRAFITQPKHIKSGYHFKIQHLLAAMNAFVDNFRRLDSDENRGTFWIKVIGFVQRQIPAHFAQAHCSGLMYLEDNPELFKRSLDVVNDVKFFPTQVNRGLGFDFAVHSSLGSDEALGPGHYVAGLLQTCLKQYVEQKQTLLLDLDLSLKGNITHNPAM